MDFDLVLRDVRLADARPGEPSTDIGVKDGRIAAIAPRLGGGAREEVQGGGRLVSAGFVETHIHLDKSCILARCESEAHRHPHRAMERVSAVKHTFTVEDVSERAAGTLEKCIGHGATRMRTHVEVDPKVGLRGLEGVKALIDRYRWAIDLEICVMPQEGLTNNPGTDELMVAALKAGATVVGAAPNYDTDRAAQIRRVFEMAREFDVDIDMHLDSGASAEELDSLLVCDLTEKYGWGGRVAIGHVSKLASMRPPDMDKVARRLAGAGVALTVLTATDLYLGGRHADHNVPRNVVDLVRLSEAGVICSVASNNILNPFTPFGDGQLLRQANMQAIVTQRGSDQEVRAIWDMTTTEAAKLMRLKDYGVAPGAPADLVMLDASDPVTALRTVAPVLAAFKRGRRTVTREPVRLHGP
ncbi:MAG TPA: amidohydrolase family protein [Reyranella sp.]|nr:amidohydrolase family protein [Reyranella sp.]